MGTRNNRSLSRFMNGDRRRGRTSALLPITTLSVLFTARCILSTERGSDQASSEKDWKPMMNAGEIQMAGVLEHVQTEGRTREDGEVGEVVSRYEKVQVLSLIHISEPTRPY